MKTKLILLAVILTGIASPSFSQTRPRPDMGIHPAVQAGGYLQTIYGKDFEGKDLNYDLNPGFRAGVNFNIPIAPDLYIQPGLGLALKGFSQEIIAGKRMKESLYYAEIPVNFLFRPQVGNGHMLLGIGPYAGYGVTGSKRYGKDNDKIKFKSKVSISDLSSAGGFIKPLDAGAGVLFGYELYSGLYFLIDGQLGLLNIYPEYEGLTGNKAVFRNFGFGLSAGFRF
ncbi:MAG TPA: outer membrane beta-barrel protein [Bacteroidales bacterium]|jgi:hypothetical protein|nr:outer membrane beta-barrel protein [Bacteroidales bacterium]